MAKMRRSATRSKRSPPALDAGGLANAVHVARAPAIRPQLATLADAVPAGSQWLHEIKFDGYRLMCYLHKGPEGGKSEGKGGARPEDQVRLITRGGHDWTAKFREIAEAIATLPLREAILDGELIAVDARGRATFNAMQNALRVHKDRRLQLHLFDVPYCDGFDLRRSPLVERKDLLKRILAGAPAGGALHYSDHVIGHGDKMFQQACKGGLEGTISKRVDSHYVSSRTSSWLKNKCKQRQEFIIGGYSEPEGARSGFGALLVGYRDGGRLVYCGRVGTGFDQATLKSLYAQLKALEQAKTPFDAPPTAAEAKRVHWVKPSLVAEVEFGEWTEDDRLRHPAFMGLRADKSSSEVVREQPVHVASPGQVRHAAGEGVEIAGVPLSNPGRMLYPEAKVTKADLAAFYERIAEWILPHIVNRPQTIVRCPKGLPGKCFYQRHIDESLPPALRGVSVREDHEIVQYIVIDDLQGLISLVQLSTLEIHPWGSKADDIERPDRLVFDLDPGPGLKWKSVVEAALAARKILAAAKLKSFVQTSGGKGLHVVVPIVPRAEWDEAKAFCRAVAQLMATREPDKYTATLSKSKREGKVFIDYLRNGRGATSVASYSTRARAGATVATPLRWEELSKVRRADAFTVGNLVKRLASLNRDPWDGYLDLQQHLPRSVGD